MRHGRRRHDSVRLQRDRHDHAHGRRTGHHRFADDPRPRRGESDHRRRPGKSRIFDVDDSDSGTNINVQIDGLTLTGGSADTGGAISRFSYDSTLTASNSTITGNTATATAAESGRKPTPAARRPSRTAPFPETPPAATAAESMRTTTARRPSRTAPFPETPASRRRRRNLGGKLRRRHDDHPEQHHFRKHCRRQGGGIYALNYGTATLQNSTVTGNTANQRWRRHLLVLRRQLPPRRRPPPSKARSLPGTPTLRRAAADLSGPVNISHSLVGKNTGSGLTAAPVGTPDAQGNLIGNSTGIDPKLGPLADNGGPTQTCALLQGSPAINLGSNPADLTTDQRGDGFPRDRGGLVDIGAYEILAPEITVLDGTTGHCQRPDDDRLRQRGSQSDRAQQDVHHPQRREPDPHA